MKYQAETVRSAWDFVNKNKENNHLFATYDVPEVQAIIEKSELCELSAKERFYGADNIRKRNKRLLRNMQLEAI